MEGESTSESPDGLGAWHPATRPDSQEVKQPYEGQQSQLTKQPSSLQNESYIPISQPDVPSPLSPPSQTSVFVALDLPPQLKVKQCQSPKRSSEDPGPSCENEKIRDSEDHDRLDGALESLAARDTSWLPVSNSQDQVDDINFPQYSSSDNEKTHQVFPTDILSYGDNEEAGSIWEANKTHTDTSSDAGVNSFPAVPPIHQANALLHHKLSRSQAEAIMEEDQVNREIENNETGSPLPKFDADGAAPHNDRTHDHYEDKNFFSALSAAHKPNILSLDDEEARFEEGLPLMASNHPEHLPAGKEHEAVDKPPKWFGADKDDAFTKDLFSSEDSTFFKPQPLDRKNTAQVLESLQYGPGRNADAELVHNVKQTSHIDLDVGASNVSNSDGISQLPSEQKAQERVLELEPSLPIKDTQEEDLAAMWQAALGDDELLDDNDIPSGPSKFFEDDGEGFLEEMADQSIREGSLQSDLSSNPELAYSAVVAHHGGSSNHNFEGQNITTQRNQSSAYFPYQDATIAPLSAMQPHPSIPNQHTGHGGTQGYSSNAIPARPQIPPSMQSFSDKSKGGYTSPYDLPMDVVRPKKRNYQQQNQPAPVARSLSHPQPPPPPRSSSIYSLDSPSMAEPHPPIPKMLRGATSVPGFDSRTPLANDTDSVLATQRSVGSFFEELPSTKPRPSSRGNPISGPAQQAKIPFQNLPPQKIPISQTSISTPSTYQLLPPERIGLYANVPQQDTLRQIPVTNSRYSPAPVPQHGPPPTQNRYTSSPSGVSRPAPPSQSMSFQPRTSSPLAQNSLSQHYQRNSVGDIPLNLNQQNVQPALTASRKPVNHQDHTNTSSFIDEELNLHPEMGINMSPDPPIFNQHSPSLPEPRHAPNSRLPSKTPYVTQSYRNGHIPQDRVTHGNGFVPHNIQDHMSKSSEATYFKPPQRSQTQSPGAARSINGIPLNAQEPLQRPASVNHQIIPSHIDSPYSVAPRQAGPRSGSNSQRFNYITPTDGRELDPLERWKGCPIIRFGFGGTVVTSFPKQVPRYSTGQSTPMLKCSPGEVKLSIGKVVPLEDNIVTFPGPLKSKTKKKEVLDWLQKRIVQLESSRTYSHLNSPPPNSQKRFEEKIVLWKMLQCIVEYDGSIEGKPLAISAARSLLMPELNSDNTEHVSSHHVDQDLLGISKNSESAKAVEQTKPETLEALRKLLLQGEREKAVWYAVDQRLWDHAILLSSTLEPKLWKQVLQEFVRQEVKTSGRNTESLASLYQIFAGNWEESVDELVPPSARAGLQMVSKISGAGPVKNALDGLERWRETLTLILSNRTQNDGKALITLGRLLSSYGRTEAAHICYIFAKTPGLFGGADDPQAGVALLGADHIQFPFDYNREFDNVLLTEIFDFATTILTSSTIATVSPHLQAYKLYHATLLAENGHRSEAQQYCDAVTAVLKSTTKLSPYYHSLLFGALEDLVERLRQAPKDGSTSWMSKPSMDKVSGSVWAKFNQFIAGDESDNGSTVSGKVHDQDGAGPFARVAGDSPNISRMPSSNELYSKYYAGSESGSTAPTSGVSNSRYGPSGQYAPAGQYTPRSSLEQARSWSSQDPRRQSDGDSLKPVLPQQQYQPRNSSAPEIAQDSPPNSYKLSSQHIAYSPQSQGYLPTPPSQPEYMPVAPVEESSSLYEDSYRPTPPPKDEPLYQPDPPFSKQQPSIGYEPPHPDLNHSSAHDPLNSNYNSEYEPPTYSYEPPSYNPDATDDAESPHQEKPKKKPFMDDDDNDFDAREAAVRKEEKAKRDRDADEAFRKAAEADGMSWLSFNTSD